MQLLATFPTRDVAASVKDELIEKGVPAEDIIVMANRESPEPPEAANLEAGDQGDKGFAGMEEKVGKFAMRLMGKEQHLSGDTSEGEDTGGALVGVTVSAKAEDGWLREIFMRREAGDIEVAEQD